MKSIFSRRRLSWGLGGTALAVVLVGARVLNSPSRAAPASANRPDGRGVVCFGHVDVEHGVTSLHPLLGGRVTAVEVRENQQVKAGAVLLRLDDFQARRRIREAQADLEAAREQLAMARKFPSRQKVRLEQQRAAIDAVRQRLTAARTQAERKRQLKKKRLATPSETDAADALVRELEALERVEQARLRELELNDVTAAVKTAQANVTAREARLDQARRAQEECALKAPADGTVLRVQVGPGEVLGPQPRQPAILFCPTGPRIIRAEVEQEFAGRVKAGQAATVQDDATGGPTWRGRVKSVSDWYTRRRSVMLEPSRFNDVRTLECLIALDPGQPPLRIGQRVRVTLKP
jgi:multidrug resistance efflux pump